MIALTRGINLPVHHTMEQVLSWRLLASGWQPSIPSQVIMYVCVTTTYPYPTLPSPSPGEYRSLFKLASSATGHVGFGQECDRSTIYKSFKKMLKSLDEEYRMFHAKVTLNSCACIHAHIAKTMCTYYRSKIWILIWKFPIQNFFHHPLTSFGLDSKIVN